MQIKGISSEEFIEIVNKVADNHSHKGFAYYTSDDIKQEVWCIVLEAINGFDVKRGKVKDVKKALEHWLNTIVARRLVNLYRDKYIVPHKSKNHNLLEPYDIAIIGDLDHLKISYDLIESEYWEIIKKYLNLEEWFILEALMSGEKIPSYCRIRLKKKIMSILSEHA